MTTRRERDIAKIAKLEAKVEKWETALESIVTGENGEYWYTEPDGGQRATKLSPMEIQKMINQYETEIGRLHNRLRGGGLTAVRTAR